MVVDLDENELRLENRKIVIPIGFAELHSQSDDVLIPNVSVDQLCSLPDYKKDALTPDVERGISSTFGRKVKVEPVPGSRKVEKEERRITETDIDNDIESDFYSHEHYNLDNLYKNRLHEAQPAENKKESQYERGLRLWEHRSEGGIISNEANREKGTPARDRDYYNDMDEETRQEMIRKRRGVYQEKRYGDKYSQNRDES